MWITVIEFGKTRQTVWLLRDDSGHGAACNWLGYVPEMCNNLLVMLGWIELTSRMEIEPPLFFEILKFVLASYTTANPCFLLCSCSLYIPQWIRVAKQIGSWSFDEIWFDSLAICKLAILSQIIPFLYQLCLIRFGLDNSAYFDCQPVQKTNQIIFLLLFANYLI